MKNSMLIDAFKSKLNLSFTENGALTNSTSLNANLDFFSLAAAKRNGPDNVIKLFIKAFNEDSTLAMHNLFYLRDVRGGQGERYLFRLCFAKLLIDSSNSMIKSIIDNKLLEMIPEYGRWDDIISLLGCNSCIDEHITGILKEQILSDIRNMQDEQACSLLAKWFPLTNCVSNIDRLNQAKYLCVKIFNNPRTARKVISSLRKHLNVLEQKLSKKDYDAITYDAICSKAHLKYHKAFGRNDSVRYKEYLTLVKEGKKKINASTIYPYELVSNYLKQVEERMYDTFKNTTEDPTIEALWKALPDYTNGENSICVVDVSGSMYQQDNLPIRVAVSLGIYFAERNIGMFHNHFIAFSKKPQMVELIGNSLKEKIFNISTSEWGSNTNINAVFNEILQKGVDNKIPSSEMPKTVYIISDMEFDEAVGTHHGNNKTNFQYIKECYHTSGYEVPTLVFWNVASRNTNVPVKKDEFGVAMVSGCSPSIFKFVVAGQTPEAFMLEVLNSERYINIKF